MKKDLIYVRWVLHTATAQGSKYYTRDSGLQEALFCPLFQTTYHIYLIFTLYFILHRHGRKCKIT